MGRFYKTAAPSFVEDKMLELPEELMINVLAKKDANLAKNKEDINVLQTLINQSDFLDRDKEDANKKIDFYTTEIDKIAKDINSKNLETSDNAKNEIEILTKNLNKDIERGAFKVWGENVKQKQQLNADLEKTDLNDLDKHRIKAYHEFLYNKDGANYQDENNSNKYYDGNVKPIPEYDENEIITEVNKLVKAQTDIKNRKSGGLTGSSIHNTKVTQKDLTLLQETATNIFNRNNNQEKLDFQYGFEWESKPALRNGLSKENYIAVKKEAELQSLLEDIKGSVGKTSTITDSHTLNAQGTKKALEKEEYNAQGVAKADDRTYQERTADLSSTVLFANVLGIKEFPDSSEEEIEDVFTKKNIHKISDINMYALDYFTSNVSKNADGEITTDNEDLATWIERRKKLNQTYTDKDYAAYVEAEFTNYLQHSKKRSLKSDIGDTYEEKQELLNNLNTKKDEVFSFYVKDKNTGKVVVPLSTKQITIPSINSKKYVYKETEEQDYKKDKDGYFLSKNFKGVETLLKDDQGKPVKDFDKASDLFDDVVLPSFKNIKNIKKEVVTNINSTSEVKSMYEKRPYTLLQPSTTDNVDENNYIEVTYETNLGKLNINDNLEDGTVYQVVFVIPKKDLKNK